MLSSDPQCPKLTAHHNHCVVDHHDHHQSSTPNSNHLDLSHTSSFSIRDYVFTARSKDIKTNWPFSLKNLQLCLKHGVKDVLPPFHSLDAIRNQSCGRCTVDNYNNNSNPQGISDDITSNGNHHPASSILVDNNTTRVESETKLPHACVDTSTSCRSGTTSVCQSETNKSALQTDHTALETASVEAEVEAEPAVPRTVSHKGSRGNSGKSKCKLIVKFSSQFDRSSSEDIASNSTTHSEAMASKICPVCKTFSSTSNTTLNAHIDQCLSVESSTPKWTVDSKLSTRHRIKPRKTRLMVDIYATALPSTLEDLDRRNGSNWASGASNFPTPDCESDDKSVERSPRVPIDVHTRCADVGAVYIDSNGIKLRILSKSDDCPQVKPFKASKFLSARKKNRRASKFTHYLKLAQTKKLILRSSQVSGDHGKKYVTEGNHKVGGCNTVNPSSSGTLRQWACSKRTGIAKKFNSKVCYKRSWNVSSQDSRIYSPSVRQNRDEEPVILPGNNPVASPENYDGPENVFYAANAGHMVEQSPGINEVRSSSSVASIDKNVNTRQLRKERTSGDDYRMLKPSKSTAILTPRSDNSDPRPTIGRKMPRSRHASRSKAIKVSSTRQDTLSGRRTAVTDSVSDVATECSGLEKSNVRLRSDEEVVPWDSEAVLPYDLEHDFAANHHQSGTEGTNQENSPCRSDEPNAVQNAGVLGISKGKEAMICEDSQLRIQYHPHGHEVGNMNSSILDKVDDRCSTDDINVSQLSSKVAVVESVSTSHKSTDSETNKLGSHSRSQSNSLEYKGPLCDIRVLSGSSGPSFDGGQEMFYGVQLASGVLVQNVNIGGNLNSEVAHGSSFADVDPIPIPGPPGSFLPSPRDMGSEDFQGNSSLTTSRVQSSQDQHDFIDGDSSDSPISATSTISNSTASRYDLKHSESLPYAVVPQANQDKIRSSYSGGSIDSPLDNAAKASRSTISMASEIKERFKANRIPPLGFKTENEPCCCQRKERATHNHHQHDHVVLNSQESQLLKRRAMASLSFPSVERQMSCYLRPNTVEASSDHMFSPNSTSEKVVLPVLMAPQTSHSLSRCPTDPGAKFRGRNDCDSMSPSSSNSILRLMGKNLMVVNRDHDESVPARQPHPTNSHIPMFSGVSGVQQQIHHPNFYRDSVIFSQDSRSSVEVQHVDARFSSGIRTTNSNLRSGQMIYHPFPNQHMPLEPREYKDQIRCRNRPIIGAPMNPLSSVKEVITIDDSPEEEEEEEIELTRHVANHGGFSVVTPLYGTSQPDNRSLILEPALVQSTGWPSSCTMDGSGALQQGQFMANPSSSSRGHLYKCQSSLL